MNLSFPNKSRSYDEAYRRIRFSGYDGMFEIRFFIEIDALAKAFPGDVSDEEDYLLAFDSVREAILAAAEKAYVRGHSKSACILTIKDFS